MAPEYIFDVERGRVEALGDHLDFRRRDKEKNSGWIHEAADQPGAGDAIDLRPFSRDPDGAAASVALRNPVRGNGWQPRLLPGGIAALKCFGRDIAVAKPGSRPFAELLPLLANDDDGAPGEIRRPVLNIAMRPSPRARDQAWVGGEVIIEANIDQNRREGRANQSRQFLGGYRGIRRHAA